MQQSYFHVVLHIKLTKLYLTLIYNFKKGRIRYNPPPPIFSVYMSLILRGLPSGRLVLFNTFRKTIAI